MRQTKTLSKILVPEEHKDSHHSTEYEGASE